MKRFYLGLFVTGLVLTGAGCSVMNNEVDETKDSAVTDSEGEKEITYKFNDAEKEEVMENWTFQGVLDESEIINKKVKITTNKGDIVFELFSETAPNTVSNFVYLTNGGYYNSLTFHRREEGFVIQGGDPSGNGTGGPGYAFADELDDQYGYDRGIVAMANSGPNTNGSQFFIMLGDTPLPKAYSIFGKVLEGMDVVDQIQVGDIMSTVLVEDK